MKKRYLFLWLCLFVAPPVMAATDGLLNKGTGGTTSTGDFQIQAMKADGVRISLLSDFTIVDSSGGGAPTNINLSHDVCYYASTASYAIKFTTVNNFNLHNTVLNKDIPYTLYWDDGKNGSNEGTFKANTDPTPVLASQNRNAETCGAIGNTNATIRVFIKKNDFNGPPRAFYTDKVTIIISTQ